MFNQGLETKKTATHSRTYSSTNRSTRHSVSSDKSLPDGRNYPEHVDSKPNPSEAIIDDDIEKRVVINEDGSLSMEMKVRFRLLNDETLQWSTQVTKNGGPKSCEYLQGRSHYFQQSSLESCSELECVVSACEEQEAYIAQRYQRHMEEAHCTHCCVQCQEYHNWTNQPIPEAQEGSRHITSSSSNSSTHTTVCRRTKVKNTSLSSEEGGGQVVETETWMESAVDTVDTIEYCTIKSDVSPQRFKGRSSVVKEVDSAEEIPERLTLVPSQSGQMCGPLSLVSWREERAGSAISASSLILASLTEDHDNEEDNLPTGVSRSDLCTRNRRRSKWMKCWMKGKVLKWQVKTECQVPCHIGQTPLLDPQKHLSFHQNQVMMQTEHQATHHKDQGPQLITMTL
ncbi:Oxygen-regulated protein 1 [Merluccius polli]|uniref:Oxygen-regulated protein 1 n=1 Tax=Merluccius polli TaxID=89951 RepID=A0AA47NRD4_MERPO|nr:Oxygen-regulated protein 1 [Merluccius polli]